MMRMLAPQVGRMSARKVTSGAGSWVSKACFSTNPTPGPLSAFTEEERAIQDAGTSSVSDGLLFFFRPPVRTLYDISAFIWTVRRFAQDVIAPKVQEMDRTATMDPEVIRGMFDQGVRGEGRRVQQDLRQLFTNA